MNRHKLLAWYLATVLAASVILTAIRWERYSGFWGYMDLVSTSIWQAVVWPLYLLVSLFGRS